MFSDAPFSPQRGLVPFAAEPLLGSFDAYMWQALETKARFIGQVITGNNAARRAEDIGGQELSYAEVKPIASGNPAVLTPVEADAELQRLALLKKNHLDEQYVARRSVRDLPGTIASLSERLSNLTTDQAVATAFAADRITLEPAPAKAGGKRTWSREDAPGILGGQLDALPKSVRDTTRVPIQGEFFSTEAISNTAAALVREGNQNSLDAGLDSETIRVRLFVSGAGDSAAQADLVKPYLDEIWPHFKAKQNGLSDIPAEADRCPFLVFEDVGTSGLCGDPLQWHKKEGVKNGFFTLSNWPRSKSWMMQSPSPTSSWISRIAPSKPRVFQWLRRKENVKEFTKNVEKLAKTVGTVGSIEDHKYLQIKELRQ